MRLSSILAAGAALLVFGTTTFAQAATTSAAAPKVNFAGKWVIIPDSAAPAAGGRGAGMMAASNEMSITHDEKAVTVTQSMAQVGEMKNVYNLDGTESYTTLTLGNAGSLPLTTKGKWGEAGKFLTTTTASFNGQGFEITMTLSIDAAGNLVVESTAPNMGGGAPATTTRKYKKG